MQILCAKLGQLTVIFDGKKDNYLAKQKLLKFISEKLKKLNKQITREKIVE